MFETTLLIAKDVIYSRLLPHAHVCISGCQSVKILVFGQIMNVNTNVSDDLDEDIVNACMLSTCDVKPYDFEPYFFRKYSRLPPTPEMVMKCSGVGVGGSLECITSLAII